MAKVKHNKFTMGLSGKIGNLVFRQRKDGTTVVAAAPDLSNRVLSQEQIKHNDRFRQAAAYAGQAAKTNPIYAQRAEGTSKNAYNVALSDWFNPPVIHKVTCLHRQVRVYATDDVLINRVLVTVSNEQGQILEQAEASFIKDGRWDYKAAAPIVGHILVEVVDLAGNVTTREA